MTLFVVVLFLICNGYDMNGRLSKFKFLYVLDDVDTGSGSALSIFVGSLDWTVVNVIMESFF